MLGQFASLQIPADWTSPDTEISNVLTLSNPKEISSDNSKWRTVELSAKIMHYLRLHNQLYFGQAHGTPFTISPLCDLVDWEA
jgi:hypothetical protein